MVVCGCNDLSHHRLSPTRRSVLGMIAASATGAALSLRCDAAEPVSEWIIDTHHHI